MVETLNLKNYYADKIVEFEKEKLQNKLNLAMYGAEVKKLKSHYNYDKISNTWDLDGKIETYKGLLNWKDNFLIRDDGGFLSIVKLNHILNKKNVSYFDGWKLGINRKITKNKIICPMNWVHQFEFSPKKLWVSIRTPEHKYYYIILKNDEYIFADKLQIRNN